jgi:hypothetical protein
MRSLIVTMARELLLTRPVPVGRRRRRPPFSTQVLLDRSETPRLGQVDVTWRMSMLKKIKS